MKTKFILTVCATSLLAFVALIASAQQPNAGQPSNQLRSGQPNAGSGLGQPGGGPGNYGQPQGQPPLGGSPGTAAGNPAGGNPAGGGPRHGGVVHQGASMVAVIDLNYVMNNYENAKKQVEELQKAGMAADTELRKDNAEIEMLKEKLKDFKPGSEDFKHREEDITHRMSDLKVRAQFEQRDFQEKQMKAMYLIYREITAEVENYAKAHGIGLVMDYPSEKPDVNVPASIQRAVTKPFVYQGGPDITQAVLDALNQRAIAARPAGGRPNAGPGGPPGGTRQR